MSTPTLTGAAPRAFLGYKAANPGFLWRVCAHCDKEDGWAATNEAQRLGFAVSHGICEDHFKSETAKFKCKSVPASPAVTCQ